MNATMQYQLATFSKLQIENQTIYASIGDGALLIAAIWSWWRTSKAQKHPVWRKKTF